MAGQIAYNFDEEDGWMIPLPLWGKMKFRIHVSRKGIIRKKKKKKSPMQNLHPAKKWGKDLGCRGILLLAARICQETPPSAGPDCLLSADSCQDQTIPDLCNYSPSICF